MRWQPMRIPTPHMYVPPDDLSRAHNPHVPLPNPSQLHHHHQNRWSYHSPHAHLLRKRPHSYTSGGDGWGPRPNSGHDGPLHERPRHINLKIMDAKGVGD